MKTIIFAKTILLAICLLAQPIRAREIPALGPDSEMNRAVGFIAESGKFFKAAEKLAPMVAEGSLERVRLGNHSGGYDDFCFQMKNGGRFKSFASFKRYVNDELLVALDMQKTSLSHYRNCPLEPPQFSPRDMTGVFHITAHYHATDGALSALNRAVSDQMKKGAISGFNYRPDIGVIMPGRLEMCLQVAKGTKHSEVSDALPKNKDRVMLSTNPGWCPALPHAALLNIELQTGAEADSAIAAMRRVFDAPFAKGIREKGVFLTSGVFKVSGNVPAFNIYSHMFCDNAKTCEDTTTQVNALKFDELIPKPGRFGVNFHPSVAFTYDNYDPSLKTKASRRISSVGMRFALQKDRFATNMVRDIAEMNATAVGKVLEDRDVFALGVNPGTLEVTGLHLCDTIADCSQSVDSLKTSKLVKRVSVK